MAWRKNLTRKLIERVSPFWKPDKGKIAVELPHPDRAALNSNLQKFTLAILYNNSQKKLFGNKYVEISDGKISGYFETLTPEKPQEIGVLLHTTPPRHYGWVAIDGPLEYLHDPWLVC